MCRPGAHNVFFELGPLCCSIRREARAGALVGAEESSDDRG